MPDLELEMLRGRKAKELMDNELLLEALATIELHWETVWKNSRPEDGKLREEAYRMHAASKLFRGQLTRVITTGKLAAKAESDRHDREKQERRLENWDGSADTAPEH